ncbi:bifunctional diguanylate cyclase/phosphodiesterase [Saccharospirillum impatiens]|uniref:bifunctional diguanylate cyclase/phosphodiesterase n=1 Tax=Saccharospirillum impatiens TaxID=169438 RepID=UPI0006865A1B|nr:EAL domain-containing protein [Saccharospirillum impatiens]
MKHAPLVFYEAESRGEQKDLWALNYVSESIEQLTGYPAEDFLGENPKRYLYQMVHPTDRRRVGAEYDRCRAMLSPIYMTYRIKHRDQGYIWVEERTNFVRQDSEHIVCLGSLVDTHAPVRIEKHNARLDKVLIRLNADVAVATGQDFIEHLCRRLALLLDCRQVSLLQVSDGQYLGCLVSIQDGLMQPRYSMRLADSLLAPLGSQPHMVRNLSDPDRHGWPILESMVHLEAFRLDNRRGRWVGILVIDHDQPRPVDSTLSRVLELYTERAVTEIERLGLEGRLQESEARYRAFFETAVQPSMIVDRQGRVVNINRSAARLFNADQNVEALQLRAILPDNQPDGQQTWPAFLAFVEQASDAETRQSQWQLQTLTGSTRTMVVHSFRVSVNQTEGVMLSFNDISDRLSAEASLREQHEVMNRRQQRLRGLVDVATRLERQNSVRDFLVSSCTALTQKVGLNQVACYQPGSEFWYASSLKPEQRTHFREHSAALQQALDTRHISWGTDSNQWFYIPLVVDDQAVAGLAILGDELILNDLDFLSMLAQTLNLSFDNLMQRKNLRSQAMHDSLTGLGNRAQLHLWIEQVLGQQPDQTASLLLFDLNRFKEINDTLGHHFGDRLLCEIGPRIQRMLGWRTSQNIARLGGDEFAVLLPDVSQQEALSVAERMALCLREPYQIDAMQLQVEASIGLSHYPEQGQDGHELLRCADVAMYAAKANNESVVVFDSHLDAHTPQRIAVLSELEVAIGAGQLWVAYQPIISAATGQVAGFEGLVRWQHPELGALSPADFIPLAEMGQGIRQITRFVLEQCLAQIVHWRGKHPDCHVAVNLSSRVLLDQALPGQIEDLLVKYALPGSALVLELTESTLLSDPVRAIAIINQLADLGVGVEVDDFGTGYSSLAYLKALPIQALKIDKSFIDDLLEDAQDRVIVESTITMAHNLGLKTVGEGVENEATFHELVRLGIDFLQGYYFAKPLPAVEMTEWLDSYHRSLEW